VCPNDCSGHGKCRLIQDLPEANTQQAPIQLSAAGNSHTSRPSARWNLAGTFKPNTNGLAWDYDKIQVCECDGEFFGPDCSQRYCPKGDDPLTTCAELSSANTISTTYGNKQQVQTLTLSTRDEGATDASVSFDDGQWTGDLLLHFTDNHGEVWTTQRIPSIFASGPDDIAAKIRLALMAIPNYKIPTVSVAANPPAAAFAATTPTLSFDITFDNERTAGNQQLLSCDPQPLGCQSVGCSPMYMQPLYVDASFDRTDFTDDSILDTSDPLFGDHDVATVVVTFAAADAAGGAGTEYKTYTAAWTMGATAVVGPYDTTLTLDVGKPNYVPVGSYNAKSAPGAATPETGLGNNRIPLGFGMYLKAGTAAPTTATYVFQTLRCAVAETQRADMRYEDIECSGRGTCDHSTGTCACFEGHYGDHCGLQTILV